VTAGSPLAGSSGMLLDVDGDAGGPWSAMSGAVGDTVQAVCGLGAMTFDPGPLHLGVAYSSREMDSRIVSSRLRRVRPSHAPMRVDRVCRLDVHQDPESFTFTWDDPLAQIPLAQPQVARAGR
jgi:hypothetical protein